MNKWGFKTYQAMRYTPPFASDVIEEIKRWNYRYFTFTFISTIFNNNYKILVQDFIEYTLILLNFKIYRRFLF